MGLIATGVRSERGGRCHVARDVREGLLLCSWCKAEMGAVVEGKPATDDNDGVAKVGNIELKASGAALGDSTSEETEEEHRVESELNDILKKGPIIIFSKSYCPYSKKAKVSDFFPLA